MKKQEDIEIAAKQTYLIKTKRDIVLAILSNPSFNYLAYDAFELKKQMLEFIFSDDIKQLNELEFGAISSLVFLDEKAK